VALAPYEASITMMRPVNGRERTVIAASTVAFDTSRMHGLAAPIMAAYDNGQRRAVTSRGVV